MTNEEKTIAICNKHIFDSNHFDCCMEMAEWKDAQFEAEKQALIDKAVKYLAPIAYTHKHLINLDDFIEYMKEKQ